MREGRGTGEGFSKVWLAVATASGAMMSAVAFFVRRHYHQKHKLELAMQNSLSGSGSNELELPENPIRKAAENPAVIKAAESDRVPKKTYDMHEI